jgi:hypothetical protein
MEGVLIILFLLGIFFLFGGTGQKKKAHPPPAPTPTDRDLVVEEMVLERFGGAIARMTDAGKTHLIEQIRQLPPRDKSIQ